MRTLALLLLAAPALAGGLPPSATFDARLDVCVPGHGNGPIKALSRLPDGKTVQGIFANKKRVLFTTTADDGCDTVYPIGTASDRVTGRFDAAGTIVKAFTMTQSAGNCPGEDEGGCSEILVFKDKAGAYRAAAPIGSCQDPELRAPKLFSKQHQGVILHCRAPGGGDMWSHVESLFGFTAAGLTRMLHVPLGFSMTAEGHIEMEKRADLGAACHFKAPGLLKIVGVGPKPVVVVREADPDSDDGKVRQSRRTWDGKAFVPVAPPVTMTPPGEIICP